MTNKVREIRLKKGISQTELARLIEVSRQTIHAVETMKYVPSIDLALRIAKILKKPVEKLFFLDSN
jgi:putative transcriptional regulator